MKYFKYNNNQANFEPVSWWYIYKYPLINMIIWFTYGIFITFNLITVIKTGNENNMIYDDLLKDNYELLGKLSLITELDEFDETNLKLVMQGMNIMYIDIAIAQSKLETSNYTSDIFIETGNLFGMKVAKLRPYTHFGEHRGHADYKGMWKLSVIDYALWQAREAKNVKTEEQYFFLLSKMYAEDSEYINKLKKIIKNEKN